MKIKTSTGRKIRYGGTSIALTALIIAVVIILNAIMTLLTKRFMWYGDLTPDLHFTLSQEFFDLIGKVDSEDGVDSPIEMVDKFRADNKAFNEENGLSEGDKDYRNENVMINIIFPVEEDILTSDDASLYVIQNAHELRAKYPDYINIQCIDAIREPKTFQKYLSSNTETISLDSVIIECGSDFRIPSLRKFYEFSNGTPIAYKGEKTLASAILAVTRAETPLACYTTNHGEKFPMSAEVDDSGNERSPFLETLEDAGYRVQGINLATEEIPEECRLLITFDPKQDFISGNTGLEKQGELKKLDAFLEDRNSFMVFLDPSTGKLNNLEEFLEEWGLAVRRKDGEPLIIRDNEHSNLGGNNQAILADYDQNDLMDGWAENISGTVVFKDAMVIEYAPDYNVTTQELASDETKTFQIGGNPAYNRAVFTAFKTYDTASGHTSTNDVKDSPFMLMGVSVETFYQQEMYNVVPDSAYVMLCGSTDFANPEYLTRSYANADFLMSAFQLSGREPVAVGLDLEPFATYKIEQISAGEATKYIVALTVAPIIITLCAGVFVLVRRKNR